MTVKEIKTELDSLGIDYPKNAKASELKALLEEAKNSSEEEEEIVENTISEDDGTHPIEEDDESEEEEIVDEEEEEPEVELKSTEDKDYLRQYQYKKVNDVPTIGGTKTDPDPGSKAAIMKKALLNQDKVRILVPKKSNEDDIPLSVNLNGYRLDIPKGQYVSLPEQIADIIMDSQRQKDEALKYNRIDGNRGKEEALS